MIFFLSHAISDRVVVKTLEIFLRLPAKTIAKCHCVSKRWASILRLPLFTHLFLTRSSTRPKLLFACHKDDHVFFFSSPQPQSLDENSSLLAANCYRLKVPNEISFDIRYSSIRGLVFLGNGHVSVICNPSTGQSLILPQVKSRDGTRMKSYLGYDPIEKQYKVLSMTSLINGNQLSEEHQVLTLGGTGELSWRKIECSIPHYPPYEQDCHICINGVLYYPTVHKSSRDLIIVFFDVRKEKFRFVRSTPCLSLPLINYNDKLASLHCYQTFRPYECRIKLRVLEDAEKQEWSEHKYKWPALHKSFVGDSILRVVGMTGTNEIVLSSSRQSESYYVFYYNIERNTAAMVDIRGMEAFKHYDVYTFLDHVEDVKLMNMFN